MHLRFANWYTVTLSGLITASFFAFERYYEEPYASILVLLPLLAVALVYQAKLATFRFYRRYTEGRVRLTKIEHLWGMDGPVWFKDGASGREPRRELWPLDRGFLPRRYFEQSYGYKGSESFVRGRENGYGIGKITNRTMTLFLFLSWGIVLTAPVVLHIIQGRPISYKEPNLWILVAGVALGFYFHISYRRERNAMVNETPCSNIIAIDFDGTLADTLFAKSRWIKEKLGIDIPRYQCDGTSLVPPLA